MSTEPCKHIFSKQSGCCLRCDAPEFPEPAAPVSVEAEERKWTDTDLYDAYLRGCEDDCLPEPLDKETFLTSWEDVQDVQ